MEEADFPSKKSDSARKVVRRRSHTRKSPSSSSDFMNMAEARREIVNALQLHRSATNTASGIGLMKNIDQPEVLGSRYNSIAHQNYGYHQLVDSIPNIPEPTWSTTAPAVLCAAVPPVEVMEYFEWVDNLSSSHSWWMGFLNSLDGKNSACSSGHGCLMESSEGFKFGRVLEDEEKKMATASDAKEESPFTDEWLIFPAAEEIGEYEEAL